MRSHAKANCGSAGMPALGEVRVAQQAGLSYRTPMPGRRHASSRVPREGDTGWEGCCGGPAPARGGNDAPGSALTTAAMAARPRLAWGQGRACRASEVAPYWWTAVDRALGGPPARHSYGQPASAAAQLALAWRSAAAQALLIPGSTLPWGGLMPYRGIPLPDLLSILSPGKHPEPRGAGSHLHYQAASPA
jgi:hypothetical protein